MNVGFWMFLIPGAACLIAAARSAARPDSWLITLILAAAGIGLIWVAFNEQKKPD